MLDTDLDWRYPAEPLYPAKIEERVVARAFERLGDQRFDPIVVDCSYWSWGDRDDRPPPGLLETGQKDIDTVFDRLERMLVARPQPWPFQTPRGGRVRVVCQPRRLAQVRPYDRSEAFSGRHDWFKAMRTQPVFAADAKRTGAFLKELEHLTHQRRRLFWSGDRLEWLLSRGFERWFIGEIEAGRATFPG